MLWVLIFFTVWAFVLNDVNIIYSNQLSKEKNEKILGLIQGGFPPLINGNAQPLKQPAVLNAAQDEADIHAKFGAGLGLKVD